MQIKNSAKLAIDGGKPVRMKRLPYGAHLVDDDDCKAVTEVLLSAHLTTGKAVERFENAIADYVHSEFAVVVSSGTAALHASMSVLGIAPGDEVIVPAITFLASSNCVVYQNAVPVFVDVDPDTLLLDPVAVENAITEKTKAIIAVDYAGQPCDYQELKSVADKYGLFLVADSCHAFGARYKDKPLGSIADFTVFSFHPVKHITTGEGGVVICDNEEYAQMLRKFRNHGIDIDYKLRSQQGTWDYDMVSLGYNYRLSDIHCALGYSQLSKSKDWLIKRNEIAQQYSRAFADMKLLKPLKVLDDRYHSYHLYVVELMLEKLSVGRGEIFKALLAEGIGVNVHYKPLHLQPFYIENFSYGAGMCAIAENKYERILSLPIFPAMTQQDVSDVIIAVRKVLSNYEVVT